MTRAACELITAAILVMSIAMPSAYAGDVHSMSTNVAVQSDYRSRGISQTDGDPAVSGGLEYSYHPLGTYLGVWASSIDFDGCTAPCTNAASVELDLYGGIAGQLGEGVGWNVAGYYYAYPDQNEEGTSEFDYVEVYGSLDYAVPDRALNPILGASLYYSPDYSGNTGHAYALGASLDLSLPKDFSLAGKLGWQDVQDSGDYVHWQIGLGYKYKALGLDLSYYDAASTCKRVAGARDLCDATLVFTISANVDLF